MSILKAFKKITCFALDVDGVLTDGSLVLLDDGEMARSMHTRDGYALQLAVKKGYRIIVISGGGNEGARKRLNKLGIVDIHFDAADKLPLLQAYMEAHGLLPEQVLYMGDDIPDYSAMKYVGLPCCPADAAPEIRMAAAYIASASGGRGCVREVIEKVLKLNGQWQLDTRVTST